MISSKNIRKLFVWSAIIGGIYLALVIPYFFITLPWNEFKVFIDDLLETGLFRALAIIIFGLIIAAAIKLFRIVKRKWEKK